MQFLSNIQFSHTYYGRVEKLFIVYVYFFILFGDKVNTLYKS